MLLSDKLLNRKPTIDDFVDVDNETFSVENKIQSNISILRYQQIQRKIEMHRKIGTLNLVNFEFGHQTFQRKIEI